MRRWRGHDDARERAVSDVIAFVLVFAIVIGSVGILYTTGFSSMESYQEGEQLRNAERAMSTFGETVNDIQRSSGVLERSSELTLREGTIRFDDGGAQLVVEANRSGTVVDSKTVSLGSVTYEHGSSAIAYEGGGVFRGEAGEPTQSIAVDRPLVSCRNGAAVVSVVQIDPVDGMGSISSTDGVELTVTETGTNVTTYTGDDVDNVSVSVSDSPTQNGWESVFESGEWDASGASGTCTDVSSVTIRVVTVDVEY